CDIASGASQDLNTNGIPDECEVVAECHTVTDVLNPPEPLPDGVWDPGCPCYAGVERSLIVAPGDAVQIADLRLHFEVAHSNAGDIVVELEHEDTGTWIRAVEMAGDPPTGGFPGEGFSVTLGDLFPLSIEYDSGPPAFPEGTRVVGNFSPYSNMYPQHALSDFAGESSAGTWTITVTDVYEGDTGALESWSLTFIPAGVPEEDCNTNGIPDECDIASGASQDLNTNGIPDECEIPGDQDHDGDVDLDDFNIFAGCLAGPQIAYPPGCDDADIDIDGDVDLGDAAIFQEAFTGSAN
ncbi:MAG: proprotein convertase P-domain-containing protein, partial [Planctomycetota bacterium]